MRVKKSVLALAMGLVLAGLTGCGSGGDDGPSITVYNAQHEELLAGIVPGFTEDDRHRGEAAQRRATSSWPTSSSRRARRSPADVFLTENSPAMSLVDSKGLFAQLDDEDAGAGAGAVLARRAATGWGSPPDRRSLVYNTDKLSRAELPASIMDLAEPEWKGRIAFSPTGADFQAIVSAVLELEGRGGRPRTGSTASRPTARSTRATTSC